MDTSGCTLLTCPLALSKIGYIPNLGGNSFLVAWFGLLIAVQVVLSVRYKTWSYLFGQLCGLALEVVGYVARIKLHENPFDNKQFIIYIVTITIAPAFLCFTIYLCFGRIVLVYGRHMSRISFRAYTMIFVTMDVICLILQAGGAAWTQADNITPDTLEKALKVLRAGLGMQIASLGVFVLLSVDLAFRVFRHRKDWSTQYVSIREKPMFKLFLLSSFIAALLILARSAFRVQELGNGFGPPDDSAQTLFMVFEGAMIGLATFLLAVFHPGPVFGSEWRMTSFFSKHAPKKDAAIEGQAENGTLSDSQEK